MIPCFLHNFLNAVVHIANFFATSVRGLNTAAGFVSMPSNLEISDIAISKLWSSAGPSMACRGLGIG
jgi:hypothetical protein